MQSLLAHLAAVSFAFCEPCNYLLSTAGGLVSLRDSVKMLSAYLGNWGCLEYGCARVLQFRIIACLFSQRLANF